MTFDELLLDVQKLESKRLRSITGSELIVEEVVLSDDRVYLITANGAKKSRPLSEIRMIWEELCKHGAAHVDEVLSGSGSSRNQPETILANLPYIEWFKYKQKKHIAFVGKSTHPYGTLQQMDEIKAEEYRRRLISSDNESYTSEVVVVASDISLAAKNLENTIGFPVEPLKQGLYKVEHSKAKILLVANSGVLNGISPGTYVVLKSAAIPAGSIKVELDGEFYYAICSGGAYLLVKQ